MRSIDRLLARLRDPDINMTEAEFARRAGLKNQQVLQNWKSRGNVSGPRVPKVCETLGITADWLLRGRHPKLARDVSQPGSNPMVQDAPAAKYQVPASLADVGTLSQADIDLVMAGRDLALHAPGVLDVIWTIIHEELRKRDPNLARWLGARNLTHQRSVEPQLRTGQILSRAGSRRARTTGADDARNKDR